MAEFTNFIQQHDPKLYAELFGLFRRAEPEPEPEPEPEKPPPMKGPRQAFRGFQIDGAMTTHASVFSQRIKDQLPHELQARLMQARKGPEFRKALESWWGAARGFIRRESLKRFVNQTLRRLIGVEL